jgi:hypothetical protein
MDMKKWDFLKISILGFLVYFVSVSAFFKWEAKWFGKVDEHDYRPKVLRDKFWKSSLLVILFIVLVLDIQLYFFAFEFTLKYCFQLIAVTIALIAALGRGGRNIESYKGQTAIERIDSGMYVISQLGATGILLFVLIL